MPGLAGPAGVVVRSGRTVTWSAAPVELWPRGLRSPGPTGRDQGGAAEANPRPEECSGSQ
ncbi:hypothetical protein SFR_4141 [Streptomyces sp. FR-008]|nr:hypothetical protein SFR_4141 [Streptomyces sp. FR-008]